MASTTDGLEGVLALAQEHLRAATYHAPAGGAATPVRLDANELSMALPADLRRDFDHALASVELGRYPDPKAAALKDALAAALSAEAGVAIAPAQLAVGNGSDELISLLCTAFSRPRRAGVRAPDERGAGTRGGIMFPSPTFVVYRLAALAAGLEPVELALDDRFELAFAKAHEAYRAHAPNLAFFALPNNPTGNLWPLADVLALARACPDMIVVADEAYAQYSGESLLGTLASTPNLVIMRTLSKIGAPSLRVGYVCAHPAIIEIVERARMPYNVGALAQAGATWWLHHALSWVAAQAAVIVAERERLAHELAGRALTAVPGAALTVFPSRANFLLCRVAGGGPAPADALTQALAVRGIAVRNLSRPGPLAECVRITVGAPSQNDALLAAL